jgi:selenocysteine lyase/cysteine desulfurase
MDLLSTLVTDESARLAAFPVVRRQIFLAHAAVTALPRVVADAVIDITEQFAANHQEFGGVLKRIEETRAAAARLIHAAPEEIALLGPTSLGLSLFANGVDWKPGDELVCYLDDYPANVYPWLNLRERGVKVNLLENAAAGVITPEIVSQALTPRTRLVALASCHFISGYRIDIDGIGKLLRERGVLFSLDAIQTLGAFPTTVEYVDFLSADAHKWLLGPLAIGVVYVRKECFEVCRPSLIGSWNVKAPGFIAQNEIEFHPTAQRYEPGVLNVAGVYGLKAAIDLLLDIGIEAIAGRLRALKAALVGELSGRGFRFYGPVDGPAASSITTVWHPERDMVELNRRLAAANVICSPRQDRQGRQLLRFSPHFYNTEAEFSRVLEVIDGN